LRTRYETQEELWPSVPTAGVVPSVSLASCGPVCAAANGVGDLRYLEM
jgi:hypothetical protein